MRTIAVRKVEWHAGEKDGLVFRFPEKTIAWNSTLVVQEGQAAALFTGNKLFSKRLKMHDVFTEAGEYVLSPSTLPLLVKEYPDSVSRTHFSCLLIYCSTKEYAHSAKIHTGDSFGQAWVHAEAVAQCKFRITNAEKFMKNVVANHKKASNDSVLKYLGNFLGDELFRQHPPYDWSPKQNIPLVEIWENVGIELLSLELEQFKQYGGGVSA